MNVSWLRRVDERLHGGSVTLATKSQSTVALIFAGACGLFMLTVALRLAGPTVHPDEWGFLSNGQVLIGHAEAPIPTGSFYPAGYGFITGLGALLTGSLTGAYRVALLANLILAVITSWASARLAIRGFGSSRHMGVLAGALVFVTPGTVLTAMFAWPETAARLAFVVFISSVMSVTRRLSATWVLVLGAGTGLMPALHGRFTLLLPIMCLVFVWWGWHRDISRLVSMGAIAATAVGYFASKQLNAFVKGALYGDSYDQETRILSRLIDPSVWPALLRTMTGQSWYLIATSGGLVGVGVVYAISRVRADGGVRTVSTDPQRLGPLVLLASSLLIIFTGGLQLLYGNRGDHMIYGRYVEILVPVLLILACVGIEKSALLARRTWIITAFLILCVAFLYVLVDRGDGLKGGYSRRNVVWPNIIGADVMRYVVSPGLITFGLVFALISVGLWWVSRRSGSGAIVILTIALATGSVYSGQKSILTRTGDLEATTQSLQLVRDSGTNLVGFDMGVRNDRSYYYLRYKLHPIQIVRFDLSGPDAVIGSEYSCVYGFPNKPPADGQWAIVADEVVLQRVLFKRLNASHC